MIEKEEIFQDIDINEGDLKALKLDGMLVLPNKLKKNTIEEIKKQLKNFNKITFNDQIGSIIISENQWIDNLGLCSSTSIQVILNPSLLELADAYFGEKAVLGSCRYQKKIKTHGSLPPHSDKGPGLVVFIFLNQIDEITGSTRFIKGSHLGGIKDKLTKFKHMDTDYVDPAAFNFEYSSFAVSGGPGTILIFNQKIIHDLPKISKTGREIIWATFYPQSKAYLSDDHIFSRNILAQLSESQRSRILFDGVAKGVPFMKIGGNLSVSDTYNISNFKRLYYVTSFCIFLIVEKFRALTGI
jgi:hypothetical protein